MDIRVEQSFILYAYCDVRYEGRAKSYLNPGNYLITHKNDGTIKIDGGALCTPLNYQPPGAVLYKQGDKLLSVRKAEKILINIFNIHNYVELKDWSVNKIEITKTEAELRDSIMEDIEGHLGVKIKEVFKEFKTPVGLVDILAIDEDDTYHIIEVKRGKANLATCSQLERYAYYFVSIMKNVRDYIASPDISGNALKFSKENFQTYIKAEHVS